MKRKYILGISLILLIAWFTYTPAAVNFPHNLLTLFLGEDHTWTASQKITAGNSLQFELDNDSITPSICFDDGAGGACDDGFYEISNGTIGVANDGTGRWQIRAGLLGSLSAGGGAFRQNGGSATVPYVHDAGDIDTGMGGAAANQVSLIAKSLEMARFGGTAGSGASVYTGGGIIIGDVSGSTVSPMTGVTAYLLIASGVSPAELSGTPGESIQLYVTGNELFVADGNGTHTGIGSFNKQTGLAESKKWNVYTGKIVIRNWETGVVTVDSGTTRDWKTDQIANQKKAFIRTYTQQSIEVPEGQATGFPDVEVDDGTRTKKYKFEKGKKTEYWAKNKKTEKGKFKTIKSDHWMGEGGKFWRKRTRAEAVAAYAVDMPTIKDKYDKLAPFLRAAVDDPGE